MKKLNKVIAAAAAYVLVAGTAAAGGIFGAGCAHKHRYRSEWTYDDYYHWHESTCEHDIKGEYGAHTDSDGIPGCDICGYKKSGGESNPDAPSNPNTPSNPNNPTGPSDPSESETPPAVNPPITDSRISHIYAANESAAFEWADSDAANAKVEYKLSSESAYRQVDKPLIRQLDAQTARVDVVGLKGGSRYDFRITTSASQELKQSDVLISAYDRSGYAHFNYADGVGAYKDDGTIKDGTLVIYLYEGNKHDVTNDCYVDGVKADITQYITDSAGTVHKGIGEILNNRRYSGDDRKNVGISRLCEEYGSVALRVIGTVSNDMVGGKAEIVGLTDYDSEGNGGSVGDSGGMARMVNAKNLTIEGIGEDAQIKGWGFHFVSSSSARWGAGDGKSFEARNLTFAGYPEDALGAEGEQAEKKLSSALSAPVERVWVHNNTFKQGGNGSAAESDKGEGDGSCDFKRGQYYTNSYNKYEDCHKTNLVGSSSTSVQFDVTFHHNWWFNCQARQPIARCANIHYYNNYVQYTTSVAMSFRADSYTFAEGNYFDGCSKVWDTNEGAGAHKFFDNVEVGTYGKAAAVDNVSSRTAKVQNNCKFIAKNIDYTEFDTSATLFYYDEANQKSNCSLTDPVTARRDCILYAGVQKHDYSSVNTDANKYTPAAALALTGDWLDISIPTSSADAEVSGVLFRDGTGSRKGKGQYATFRLADRAEIKVTCDGNGDLLSSSGAVVATKITEYRGTLEAGIYFIRSSQCGQDSNLKEVSLTSLAFKSGVSDAERVANVIALIEAIGNVELNDACAGRISAAQAAYAALDLSLRSQVTNAATLENAVKAYDSLIAAKVVELIKAIGEVDKDSGSAISAAREAYNDLTVDQKTLVENAEDGSVFAALLQAEKDFSQFETAAVNSAIEGLKEPASATTKWEIAALLEEYRRVENMYNSLDEDKREDVDNYSKVTEGLAALERALRPYEVRDMIDALPEKSDVGLSHSAEVEAARKAYDALDAAGKQTVGDITRLTDAEDVLKALASQSKVGIFTKDNPALASGAGFTVTGNYKDKETFEYGGNTYNGPLKMESSTIVTFTTAAKMKMTFVLHAGGKAKTIKVDGKAVSPTDEIVLEAGEHKITRNDGEAWLCYVILTPVDD